MTQPFHWGIVGTGKIAGKFAEDLQLLENAVLYGVASRSKERAKTFAHKHRAIHFFDSYEGLAKCGKLDAVYVATPHTVHCENTLLYLENKVPVLCEKPFAMNARQVQQMIIAACQNDTFLMEALWTRFIPTTQKVLDFIEAGAIGDIKMLKADFGFKAPFLPDGRLFKRELGGGALLDVGLYPVFLALMLLGKPRQINAMASFGPTNVDESCAMLFQYPNDAIAILDASVVVKTNTEAFIYGDKGTLHLPARFHHPAKLEVNIYEEKGFEISIPYKGNGYYHEAMEVMECVAAGKKESDRFPLKSSLELIETLDAVRKEAGIVYPAFD